MCTDGAGNFSLDMDSAIGEQLGLFVFLSTHAIVAIGGDMLRPDNGGRGRSNGKR